MMTRKALLDAWRALSGLSRAAMVLAVAAIAVVLWTAPSLFSALFAGSLAADPLAPRDADPDILAYRSAVEGNREFVSLRSPFFQPAAPVRPVVQPQQDGIRPPPPPPATYGGPKLVGLAGQRAVFASPVYNNEPFLSVGERGAVELLAIELPWKARVRWNGAEFTLNLFDHVEQVPIVNFETPSPLGSPGAGANIFGGGTAATATFNLESSAGDADDVN